MNNRLTMGFFSLLLVCSGFLLMAGTVAAQSPKMGKAAVAAEKWLALVDGGNYAESWTEAAGYFKNAVTQAKWEQSLTAVRKPLGKLISRKINNRTYTTSLPGAPDGEYVVIQFETSFANKKSALETVTSMLDKDGKWRVAGDFIK